MTSLFDGTRRVRERSTGPWGTSARSASGGCRRFADPVERCAVRVGPTRRNSVHSHIAPIIKASPLFRCRGIFSPTAGRRNQGPKLLACAFAAVLETVSIGPVIATMQAFDVGT